MLPSPALPCSANRPCTFGSFAAPRLSTCVRRIRLRFATRSAPATGWTHAAFRTRLYSTRRADNGCAMSNPLTRKSSGILVSCASQQKTHGGADQVQYQQVALLVESGPSVARLLFSTGCGCHLWCHGPCSDSPSHLLRPGSTLCSKLQLPGTCWVCHLAAMQ